MYYEEKFINDKLMCRTTPDGEWRAVQTPVANLANMLHKMDDDVRLELFNKYCLHCGCDNPSCRCWDDS